MTHILLLGDSLIADHDWQSRMPGYLVSNYGVPGMVTSELLESLAEVKQNTETVDVILVMIGTNDLLSGDFDFINKLKEIIVEINRNYPTAELIINSLFQIELPHLPYKVVDSLNCQIEAITTQTGSCFLDTHRRLKNYDAEIFQDDGVHITDEAYELWSRSLLEYISFLIDEDDD